MSGKPVAIEAASAAERSRTSNYPPKVAQVVAGRIKKPLGDLFSLRNFGVNLARLPPGTVSPLHHGHTRQDEFIYILEGSPTLVTDSGRTELRPGMCAGFPAGGPAHHLVNETKVDVVYLEVGDRTPDDEVYFPDDDLQAHRTPEGKWSFSHKDGRPY